MERLLGWSICSGIGWSVSTGEGGQFTPEYVVSLLRFFQLDYKNPVNRHNKVADLRYIKELLGHNSSKKTKT